MSRDFDLPVSVTIVCVVAAFLVLVAVLHFRRRRHRRNQNPSSCQALVSEPTANRKEITLSPKRILGLDDGTYLTHLPRHELSRNPLPITVRPARHECESESSKRGHQRTTDAQEQGVSPWDMEYKPNPVIFAHLAARTPSPPTQPPKNLRSTDDTLPNGSKTVPSLSLVDTSSSSADNAISSSGLSHSGSSQTSEDDRSIEMVAKKSQNSVNEQLPQNPPWMSGDGKETLNRHGMLYGDRHDFLKVLTASTDPQGERVVAEEIPSRTRPEMPSALRPALIPSDSPSTLNSTPSNIEDGTGLLYTCPDCPKTCRTPDLLRNHCNRIHNLRYTCNLCNSVSFGLAADLKRHKRNVHQQSLGGDETYQCTLPGCATPNKIFRRKDNYNRHVKRCRRRIGKGRAE